MGIGVWIGLVVFGIVVVGLLYILVIRSWHMSWGATKTEQTRTIPGDDIVKGEVSQTTRAIDVNAPTRNIWPWLVQMGQGRGGMYSYDFLENLVGCDIHTLNHIVPELQRLQVGDPIRLGPQKGLPYYRVVLINESEALVLQSVNPENGAMGETWGFYQVETQPGQSRLIIRHRTPPSVSTVEKVINGLFEPIVFIMEQRMLVGLRRHAEN